MSTPSTRKLPSFPLYAQDFLVGTTFMTPAQRGGYIVLLCHQWVHGGLPDNEEVVSQMAGISGIDLALVWQKFACDSDGMRRNSRLEKVRREVGAFSSKQSANAKSGWEKRKKAPKANANRNAKRHAASDAKGMPKTCSSSSDEVHPIVPQRDASAEDDWDEDKECCHVIWDGHPQKARGRSSKVQVEKAWKAIPAKERPSHDSLIDALVKWRASEEWKREDGRFASGVHLWVKHRKWQVEPTAGPRHGEEDSFLGRQKRSNEVSI